MNKKSVVIFFSRADENYAVGYIDKGNTEVVAEYIKDIINADLYKVIPLVNYSKEYNIAIEEAKERQLKKEAKIQDLKIDINKYDVIYIGTPIYWGGMPQELITALKNINFSNKTIRVFTTHEGSGIGNVLEEIKNICLGAHVLTDALAIKGSECKSSREVVERWLKNI